MARSHSFAGLNNNAKLFLRKFAIKDFGPHSDIHNQYAEDRILASLGHYLVWYNHELVEVKEVIQFEFSSGGPNTYTHLIRVKDKTPLSKEEFSWNENFEINGY